MEKIKPALSAGRVQSVAVRLIVEREKEIKNFKAEEYYRVVALLHTDNAAQPIRAELNKRLPSKEAAMEFLESCKNATFSISDLTVKPLKKSPAAPFTTSTLQQEASRKLGFTVSQTMMVAQRLYESGHITYMRTDSVNLSSLALGTIKEEIATTLGDKYYKARNYHTSAKGAQEAHEAIRPTYISHHEISGTAQEKRLYDLIWKRTIATQMADAELEKTTAEISIGGRQEKFVATGEVIKFDGFLHVYMESTDDESNDAESDTRLPELKKGETIALDEIDATQRYTQQPPRYSEAMLVKKLEELGIGRPSTYAPTISTIQNRDYVEKGEKTGTKHDICLLELKTAKSKKRRRKSRTATRKTSSSRQMWVWWSTISLWNISPTSWTTTSLPTWRRNSTISLKVRQNGTMRLPISINCSTRKWKNFQPAPRAQGGRTRARHRPENRQRGVGENRTFRTARAARIDRQRGETAICIAAEGTVGKRHNTRGGSKAIRAATHSRRLRGRDRDGGYRTLRPIRETRQNVCLGA